LIKKTFTRTPKLFSSFLVHGVFGGPTEVKKRPRKIVTVARTPKQSIPHLEQFEVEMIPGMKSSYSRFIYIQPFIEDVGSFYSYLRKIRE